MNTLAYKLEGSRKKGVLLLHGMSGAPGEMRYLAKKLNRAGFTVHVPLLAGHGADEKVLLASGWTDWLVSALEAHDALAREVEEVYAAGICAGAGLSVALARERPRLAGLAAYSTTFLYDGWNMSAWGKAAPWLQYLVWLPGLRGVAVAEPSPYGLKDERLRELAATNPHALIEGSVDRLPLGCLRQLYRLGAHVHRIAPEVRTPALILHACEDDMSHGRNAERLASRLGGPVRLEWLQDSYHMIHVDKERAKVAALTAQAFGASDLKAVAPTVAEAAA